MCLHVAERAVFIANLGGTAEVLQAFVPKEPNGRSFPWDEGLFCCPVSGNDRFLKGDYHDGS